LYALSLMLIGVVNFLFWSRTNLNMSYNYPKSIELAMIYLYNISGISPSNTF